MTKYMLKHWALNRWLGLKNIPTLIKYLSNKNKPVEVSSNNLKLHWTVNVSDDTQLDRAVEAMEGHTESYPYWYSTRLFKGRETLPSQKDEPEFWVGIRCTFLTPIIPIPICSDEKVFKIGPTNTIYYDSYKKYGRFYQLLLHKEEYTHRIIEDCTVNFINEDVTYKNDELWSSYDK